MSAGSRPLERIVVSATSPDRKISVTLSGGDQIDLRFEPRAYRTYSETTLAHQLEQLATLTWVAYRRDYFKAVSEAVGEVVRGDESQPGSRVAAYKQAQAALDVWGRSAGGWVEAASQGLFRWQVWVAPETCRRLTEEQFRQEADSALRALLMDYDEKLAALRDEFFQRRRPAADGWD